MAAMAAAQAGQVGQPQAIAVWIDYGKNELPCCVQVQNLMSCFRLV